jgi:hypothetical protein
MDGQNYVYFASSSGDDSYMNSSANFRGADVGATFIDLFFTAANSDIPIGGYDKVRLTVTATYEEAAMKAVGAALAGAKNPVTVIADDLAANQTFVHERITAVAITLATKAITRAPIVSWTAATELTASQSGVTVVTGDTSAGILTMPTAALAGEGWFCDVMINHDQGSAATHITVQDGYFIGGVAMLDFDTDGEGIHFNSDNDSNDYINLDANTKGNKPGGHVRIVCDGTNWLVSGILIGQSTLGTPFADAES